MSNQASILLIGCGNMGQALLRGWLENGWAQTDIHVLEPDAAAQSAVESLGVSVSGTVTPDVHADVAVLAVKPQQLDAVLPDYRHLVQTGSLFLSIAAGRPISFYEGVLGAQAAIVRGMPNTPAAIGQSMTVLVGNAAVGPAQRETSEALMAAVGRVAWLEDEGLMDAVTGVSGSGPAYVFLLIECLSEAGVELGLGRELAGELAVTTVAGAGALALSSGVGAAELRRRVTSPGGTTAAALEVLSAPGGLHELMKRAVRAATERGRDLA